MNLRHARGRTTQLTLVLAAAGLLAAACGSGSSGGSSAAQVAPQSTPTATTAGSGSVVITTHSGSLGTYLTDSQGRSLYMFAADSAGKSNCNGSCAKYWPPLKGTSVHVGGASIQAAMTGTTKRGDGSTQLTYGSHPLYYYAGDTGPGTTNGQGLDLSGGKWWLINPQGKAITGASGSTSSSTPSSSSGGGYGGY